MPDNHNVTLPDAILIDNLVLYGYHGVYDEERALGQRFILSLECQCDLHRAGRDDQLAHTVNYEKIIAVIKQVMQGPPVQLLEHLGEAILQALFEACPPLTQIQLKLLKATPPIVLETGSVGIRITRAR
jgi:7,8-dihydroneopterin aldolase/epimerase/oxygenase